MDPVSEHSFIDLFLDCLCCICMSVVGVAIEEYILDTNVGKQLSYAAADV